MIFQSLRAGFGLALQNKRMLVVFYLANLFFGLLMMLTLRGFLLDFTAERTVGASLAGALDMDFFFEFLANNPQMGTVLFPLMVFSILFYALVSMFLSGGAFAIFAAGASYHAGRFWGAAATHFGRFFRLALWTLPALAVFLLLPLAAGLVSNAIFGSDPAGGISWWTGWTRIVLGYVALMFFAIVYDYGRIHAVTTGETKMRKSFWYGLKFTFRHTSSTFGLMLLFTIIGALLLLVYNPIADSLSAPSGFVILLLFLLQQIYIFLNIFLTLSRFASETKLHATATAAALAPSVQSDDQDGLEGAPAY